MNPATDALWERRLAQHNLTVFAKNPIISILGAGAIVRNLEKPTKKPVAIVVEADCLAGIDRGHEVPFVQFLPITVQARQRTVVAGAANVLHN
jgi:hypothetical protein